MAKQKPKDAAQLARDAEAQAPHAPEAKPLWDLFDAGNLKLARKKARELIASGAPEPAKAEARDLIQRTQLEPGLLATLVLMIIALGVIVALLASHRH